MWFDPTEHEAWVRATSLAVTEEQLPAETRAALARLSPATAPVIAVEPEDSGRFFQVRPRSDEFEWKYLYGLLFPRGRLRLFRFAFFDLRVWAALVLWAILQVIGALLQAKRGSAVAYFAHVGGALAGLAFWCARYLPGGLATPRTAVRMR